MFPIALAVPFKHVIDQLIKAKCYNLTINCHLIENVFGATWYMLMPQNRLQQDHIGFLFPCHTIRWQASPFEC